jgi:TFIIF-interacting CTD phosphatase-like protein
LILDLDNTLIHCARDLDGELEIELPKHPELTEDAMELHSLEAILNSASESIQDGLRHLYYIEASKISHVEDDQGLMVFKLRPGVIKFLQACSEMYELAICTMGTADYAMCVKGIRMLPLAR